MSIHNIRFSEEIRQILYGYPLFYMDLWLACDIRTYFSHCVLDIIDDDTPSGFPMEILECTNLQHLDLYYQGIVSIPPEISKLQDLRLLNVSHNPNLLSLPAELGTVTSLTSKLT